MRTFPRSLGETGLISLSLCLCLCLLQSPLYAEGLRLRGEQLPGERARAMRPTAALASRYNGGPQGRIAGGDLATLGAWPSIVSVQNQFEFPFCSGVIIDDYWILTAASCVSGLRARNIIILAGTLASWNTSALGYDVDQIHVHCNFDKPLYHNDIALLHLTGAIEYNQETAKADLAEVDELLQGEKLSFAGWGTSSPSGTNAFNLLQSSGSYLPVADCRTALGNTEDVDLGHVCVQMEAGKGMCHGDTGGPLINEQGQLVGIGNWGVPCGLGYPDVYARVAFYNDWIRTVINGCA